VDDKNKNTTIMNVNGMRKKEKLWLKIEFPFQVS
jgi:hypothetical protein